MSSTLLTSTSSDEEKAKKAHEDEQNKMMFNSELSQHNEKLDIHMSHKHKLCSLLLKKCNTVVATQFEAITDHDKFSLVDPVRSLKEIETICLTCKGVKHPCTIYHNSVASVRSIKQADNESVKDCIDKCTNQVKIMKSNK